MSDEVVIGAKTYISSRRAAETTGYAQDYIGQLARTGQIDAQRVGGLWYISLESLESYKDTPKVAPPQSDAHPSNRSEPDSIVGLDGKTYISATRASALSGYNQDYVGQLARSGKILSRQVGNRWFVEQESILAHKEEKDSLLAAVQAESVQLYKPNTRFDAGELMTYHTENADLMPNTRSFAEDTPLREEERATDSAVSVPIRVVSRVDTQVVPTVSPLRIDDMHKIPSVQRALVPRKNYLPMRRTLAGAALTIVIVLSFGYATLRSQSAYTLAPKISQDALGGSVYMVISDIADRLEKILTTDLVYIRKD